MEALTYSYLLPFVGGHEGKVLKAYRDPVHVITIGYGFTWGSKVFRDWWAKNRGPGKLKMGDTMTAEEAFKVLFLVLSTEYVPPAVKKFPGQPETLQGAASSMLFNCGVGAINWSWATLIASGQKAAGIARWRTQGTTASGKKLPGLVKRRNEEADIAATGKWPAWVKPWDGSISSSVGVETHTIQADIAQAQKWLTQLGYNPGETDGIPGPRTKAAVLRFQKDHGQLVEDGVIGPATLSALQRAIEFRGKAGTAGGAAGGAVAGGVVESGTGAGDAVTTPAGDLGWLGDVLIWGGLAVGIALLLYFGIRYKDEIGTVLRKLA